MPELLDVYYPTMVTMKISLLAAVCLLLFITAHFHEYCGNIN